MKTTAALAHIRQLCNLGLSSEAVMPALLKSVHQLVRADSAGFFWVDARGEMSNLYADRMLPPELMRRYFERYYASPEHGFSKRLKERVAGGEFVFEGLANTEFEATRYYQEILSPLDAFRPLHAIVHDRGRILGQLSLYRGRRGPRFTAAERDVIGQAAQHIRHCFASNQKPRADNNDAFRDSGEEALVIASTEGEIATASYRAYALLAHASGEPINRDTMAGAVDRASRDLLKRLAVRLQRRDGQSDSPGSLIVENTWGRYRLRAYLLSQFEMGVLIQRQEHLLVRVADAMLGLALSPQQEQVALLLAQGKTNGEIAKTMGVTLNTAAYHLRQLFTKLDAHDRAEAIANILDGHTTRSG
jgi:DNA-binding CsgD family transcriptional regulator